MRQKATVEPYRSRGRLGRHVSGDDSLGHAASTDFAGPPKLADAPRGASVLILGAGLPGMVAALELRRAGYDVRIIEYQNRAGGRNWSLHGGDASSNWAAPFRMSVSRRATI